MCATRRGSRRSYGGLFLVDAVAAHDLGFSTVGGRGRGDFVGKRDVAARAEAANVRAVFVFDAKEGPHASPENLTQRYSERRHGRVLELQRDDGVHDPIEPEEGVDDDGGVVPPDFLVAEFLAEKTVFGVRVAETPVVVDVPEASVEAVYGCEGDEHGASGGALVHAVDAQGCIEHDCGHVFAPIEQMGEFISCVGVAAETLQCTPDSGQGCHEAYNAEVGGVARTG